MTALGKSTTEISPGVWSALGEMARHPIATFLLGWNWKAALLSVAYRAPIFFIASVRHGLGLAMTGTLVEAGFNAVGSGLYGSFLQRIRNAQPRWLASLLAAVAVPAVIQISLFLFHQAAGTLQLRGGIVLSLALSVISAAFNLYAMRRGTLLAGKEAQPFVTDLMRLPATIADFLLAVPRWLLRTSCGGRSA